MKITQVLKHAAEINPSGLATIDLKHNRQQTWLQSKNQVAKLAGALQSLGLKKHDRVAVLTQNSDVHFEFYFATIWAGGIFVPLNTRLTPREIGLLLNDCGAEILIVDHHNCSKLAKISEHSSQPKHIIYTGNIDKSNGWIDHESFLKSGEAIGDENQGGEDIAMIIYTGGTTGQPRGAMLTHNNIISNSRTALDMLHDDDSLTYLHAAPMYHIADCQWNLGVTMAGGTHVFLDKFDPKEVLFVIDRYQITHTALVPTMIKMLCDVNGIHLYDHSSLRKVNFGGSPITPQLIQKARNTLPHCEFIQGYGLTETSPNISMLPDRYNTEGNPKIESAGQPVPGMSVKIVDEDGIEVPHGTIGEIITKGPHVMAGYWNQPKETKKTIRNDWLQTGDLGYMNQDGFIFIVDRLKDIIITGGENVYSTEVEKTIQKMNEIDSCAVIGIPDEKWGEAVHAIVVPEENEQISEQEVLNHCRKHLADYKCPKSVEIRHEPLPMSGPGKILKRELRKPFWPKDERQIN